MEKVKPVILIICDYYLPGFESGGAMRTLVNMVDRLGDSYHFKIVTRDHDGPLNRTPYSGVRINEWNRVQNTDVYYLSKDNVRLHTLKRIIHDTRPDAIYLNSFFSPLTVFTLILRKFTYIRVIPVILAPEGELVPGALSIKPVRKQLYIKASKLLTLLRHVVWKGASEFEKNSIEATYGYHGEILIAPNMPPRMILDDRELDRKPEKRRGHAKLVFLSRVARKKNLKRLLEIIQNMKGDLLVDIYGPVEDDEYWQECQSLIKTFPDNVQILAKGPVSHEKVVETLVDYHFFVLPTLGENFGHIFVEALAAGCPLIISDRSPWRNLESRSIGWDIPLEDTEKWLTVIGACLEMTNDKYHAMSANARKFAVNWLCDPEIEAANRSVIEFALGSRLTNARS